jgi:peptidoglycan biosynthesis protein MviN/MurJ (putative lipid II flippase)
VLLNQALSLVLNRVVRGAVSPFGEPVHPFAQFGLWSQTAGQGPFGGLALANALATTVESAALWLLLRRRTGGLEDRTVLGTVARALLACVPMAAAVLLIVRALGETHPILRLAVGGGVGLVLYILAALAMRMPEAQGMAAPVLRRLRRSTNDG